MANFNDALAENVAGPYYVDGNCIACGVCPTEASANFTFDEDESFAYVFKQPENDEETEACNDALESCPVDAIGDDGDDY